jgi:hypothetical protein
MLQLHFRALLQTLSGFNTLLLGSYGRQLLFYPLEQLFATMLAAWAEEGVHLFDLPSLAQTETRQFPTPIYGIVEGDVTSDGVPNLMVLTHDGLHVLEVWGGACILRCAVGNVWSPWGCSFVSACSSFPAL